jgi:acetylornithine deacetylase/succinyl-diaminopimelate desuccinylase-like protein
MGAAPIAAALLAQVALSCATVPPPPPPPDPQTQPSARIVASADFKGIGWSALEDLSAYLQVDTVNPPGNEARGAAFLADKLMALLPDAGLVIDTIDHGNERHSLIVRLPATVPGPQAKEAFCLVNHIDVVTSEAPRWTPGRGPLSGAVVSEGGERFVYGRGALDMKGMAILQVHALTALARSGLPRHRDVVFLAVADEEVASIGMEAVISDAHWDKVGCSHAINEGGLGLRDAIVPGQTVFAVSVGERGVLWIRVFAEGPPGHGSTPIPGRAPGKLLEAMRRIDAWQSTPTIHPALYELLAAVGREAGGVNGFVMQRPTLVDWFVVGRLQEKPTTRAITNNTIHLTGFGGAEAPNVVPSEVFAQYDIRILPGTSSADLKAIVEALVQDIPGTRIEVLEVKEPSVSPWDDPVYRVISRHAVQDEPRTIAGPIISPGYTDSILLRKRGVRAYGVVPVVVEAVDAASMHGDNERLSEANIVRGIRALAMMLADVVAQPSPQ